MLVTCGVGEPVEASVTIDPYVPLDVSLGERPDQVKLYWRCGPKPASLVEVGVWAESGAIASVTATMLAASKIAKGDVPGASPIEPGVPIVDTATWSRPFTEYDNRFVDSDSSVSLVVGVAELALWFSEQTEVSRWVGDARLAFGIGDDGSLLAIRVGQLPEGDVHLLID